MSGRWVMNFPSLCMASHGKSINWVNQVKQLFCFVCYEPINLLNMKLKLEFLISTFFAFIRFIRFIHSWQPQNFVNISGWRRRIGRGVGWQSIRGEQKSKKLFRKVIINANICIFLQGKTIYLFNYFWQKISIWCDA